jgi:hypothetical protein
LKGAVAEIEALTAVSNGGSEIAELFKLPISPSNQMIITGISHSCNLHYASLTAGASSELTDDQRGIKPQSIIFPGGNPSSMEISACLRLI